MTMNNFRVDPEELDALAIQLEPLGSALREESAAELGRANQAGRGNPGYYTAAALDHACQQLRSAFDSLASQTAAYQAEMS